jgi:PAS domain S-box-containing protein
MIKGNILFICRENAVHSQMAEGFAKKFAPGGTGIFSAGTDPAPRLNPVAVPVMKRFGIDISNQHPKGLTDLNRYRFDLAVTLCPSLQQNCPTLAGAPAIVHWVVDEPGAFADEIGNSRQNMEQCCAKIKSLVADLFHKGYFDAFIRLKKNIDHMLNHLTDGVIAHDLNRRIFFFSDGAAELTGYSPADILGKDCHGVFEPRLCGTECSFCEQPDTVNFTKKRYPVVFHDADGRRKELEVTVVPMRDETGAITGVISSLNDRTSLRSLERELGRQNGFAGLVGRDHQMLQIFQQIRDVALYDAPVNIQGETGTGKELVAKAIHNESGRRNEPFVPINCGALPDGLIESELFGHVKGSFSGAMRDKKGRFELAGGGTIFLDEVAELPKHVQVKLLRFLQEGTLEKVGSEKTVFVDARIISASNRDLKKEVQKGNFRDDLYYRLNVIPITIPPLRKRKNDISLLANHFLRRIDDRSGSPEHAISNDAMSLLLDYHWPGNVRELENAIQFAVIKARGQVISPDNFPMELLKNRDSRILRGPSKKLGAEAVTSALVRTGGNKARAAKLLGVGRATLYRFLNNHPGAIPDDL